MTVAELIATLEPLIQEATIVTGPTVSSPAPIWHIPCNGTGFISGQVDDACKGTGQVSADPLVKVIASGGVVTATSVPVLS
jgi:hypothetical protein